MLAGPLQRRIAKDELNQATMSNGATLSFDSICIRSLM